MTGQFQLTDDQLAIQEMARRFMATELEAARALLYLAAANVTEAAPDKTRFSAMAKRLATDSGSNVVNNALQLFGGHGYLRTIPSTVSGATCARIRSSK